MPIIRPWPRLGIGMSAASCYVRCTTQWSIFENSIWKIHPGLGLWKFHYCEEGLGVYDLFEIFSWIIESEKRFHRAMDYRPSNKNAGLKYLPQIVDLAGCQFWHKTFGWASMKLIFGIETHVSICDYIYSALACCACLNHDMHYVSVYIRPLYNFQI